MQGHELDLVLLAILGAVSALLVLAYRTQLPYPILLVVGGGALGFIPGIPDVSLPPELVLLVVLPPLLYAAAFQTAPLEARNLGVTNESATGRAHSPKIALM